VDRPERLASIRVCSSPITPLPPGCDAFITPRTSILRIGIGHDVSTPQNPLDHGYLE
jgi:hypothetical protein